MLERADAEPEAAWRRPLLTFVVAGGGFAGAELIGGLNDFVRGSLWYYPRIRPEEVSVVLVHSGERILPELSAELAAYARARLEDRGVTCRLGVRLSGAGPGTVALNNGETIPAETLVWTAGNAPHPLLKTLGVALDNRGAVKTDETLAVVGGGPQPEPGSPSGPRQGAARPAGKEPVRRLGEEVPRAGPADSGTPTRWESGRPLGEGAALPRYGAGNGRPGPWVWAVGDCAAVPDAYTGRTVPPTAQHALREARTAARNVHAAIRGKALKPFRYRSLGSLAVLGHQTACAELYGRKFSGLLAWWMWRMVYLGKLPTLEKRVRVALDWLVDIFFPRDIVQIHVPERDRRDAEPRHGGRPAEGG
jgi:NADH dehydrogenase